MSPPFDITSFCIAPVSFIVGGRLSTIKNKMKLKKLDILNEKNTDMLLIFFVKIEDKSTCYVIIRIFYRGLYQ